ncbi:MAG: hypothetical protein ACJ73S_27295 [Mycobacteriales bacterium]
MTYIDLDVTSDESVASVVKQPLPLYTSGRRTFDEVLAKNASGGDAPAVVAKVIVAAATDRSPKLRRTAGSKAASISALHRVLPARIFDRIVRRFNRMPN